MCSSTIAVVNSRVGRCRRNAVVAVVVAAMIAVGLAGCGSSDESSTACTPVTTDERTVPRLWIEENLAAIRRDFPAPTVHARNLWHLSAVMWDAWAAYDPDARQYFGEVRAPTAATPDDIEVALSVAAHTFLRERYEFAIGGEESVASFDGLLEELCIDPAAEVDAGSPAALGREIAASALAFGLNDGSGELERYVDLSYQPLNDPLIVMSDEAAMEDPNRWQPLQLGERITQNGLNEGPGVQVFIGSQWGEVTSFSLPAPDDRGVTIDPGPPPLLGTDTADDFRRAINQVIWYASVLGGEPGSELIDIGPGGRGNNPLGTDDGTGHELNPATGEPYAPNLVSHADYGRAIAEFWADGPDSETPPGHWNSIAIDASDRLPQDALRWAGEGEALERIEWDLRLFFALNGSLHDAAIAVWGTKRAYDYARPISMIRYLGGGAEGGLILEEGLVELTTEASVAVGGRHEGLEPDIVVVQSWLGPVDDPETQTAGTGWLPASAWLPYQRPTFVSPAFAGYVSGHSGFSRAAADVLTMATGSEFFPGGLFTHSVPAGTLLHEEGPSEDIELQWATYGDAADEAGESRRYGGIHVEADDLAGRMMGAEIAVLAWAEAANYFG